MATTNRLAATQSSARTGTGSDEWRTPPDLLDALQRRFGVWLAFDTACTPENRIHTAVPGNVGLNYDGLDYDWRPIADSIGEHNTGKRPIALWCNPPFSQAADWMEKCRYEAQERGARVFALVPVRSDTAWWNASVHRPPHMPYGASRVLLLKGRLQFKPPIGAENPKGASSPFPSCVVVYEPGHYGPPQYEVWDWRTWLKNRVEFERDTGRAANDNNPQGAR